MRGAQFWIFLELWSKSYPTHETMFARFSKQATRHAPLLLAASRSVATRALPRWRWTPASPMWMAGVASVAAAAAWHVHCEGEKVKEAATGLEFDSSYNDNALLGTGCRYKFGFVKVCPPLIPSIPLLTPSLSVD